jgi:hypothetical protein
MPETTNYKIAYYFTRFSSDGLDDYEDADSEKEAIEKARKRIKGSARSAAHAVITRYGGHVATVLTSKGRVLTKKKN